jgi:fumarate hydratase class II
LILQGGKSDRPLVNHRAGRLGDTQKDLIVRVCEEILAGQHLDQFPLHVWMTDSAQWIAANRWFRAAIAHPRFSSNRYRMGIKRHVTS